MQDVRMKKQKSKECQLLRQLSWQKVQGQRNELVNTVGSLGPTQDVFLGPCMSQLCVAVKKYLHRLLRKYKEVYFDSWFWRFRSNMEVAPLVRALASGAQVRKQREPGSQ